MINTRAPDGANKGVCCIDIGERYMISIICLVSPFECFKDLVFRSALFQRVALCCQECHYNFRKKRCVRNSNNRRCPCWVRPCLFNFEIFCCIDKVIKSRFYWRSNVFLSRGRIICLLRLVCASKSVVIDFPPSALNLILETQKIEKPTTSMKIGRRRGK